MYVMLLLISTLMHGPTVDTWIRPHPPFYIEPVIENDPVPPSGRCPKFSP